MKNTPLVSIICATYNHAKFIRQCLDGFVMQKTTFPFEVLIHDDASTDGTADIIREYEQKYPEIIKPIYQTENQYSKGVKVSRTYNFPRAQGKYMAMCEGDDYWIDEYKLQKQVDFLEANEDFSICFHPVKVYNEEEGEFVKDFTDEVPEITDIKTIATGNYIHTPSVMYRYNKQVFDDLNNFPKLPVGDYGLHMLFAEYGKIKKLQEEMAVYRMHKGGAWSSKPQEYRYLNMGKLLIVLMYHFINKPEISSILGDQYKRISIAQSDAFIRFIACNIYYDTGNGFSEKETDTFSFIGNKIEISINIPVNTVLVRFDPIENFGCVVSNLKIVSRNGPVKYKVINGFTDSKGNIVFTTDDPQIEIQGAIQYLKINCQILVLSETSHYDIMKEFIYTSMERDSLFNERDKLMIERDELLNSRSWRITKPLRNFAAFIRRNKPLYLFAKGLLSIKRNGIVKTIKIVIAYCNKRALSNSTIGTLSYESEYQNNIDFSKYNPKVKAIAFYLPQFHTIPENDKWWGKGFTEWTNTRKAKPRFKGHYQPREPHKDIGYYNLLDVETLKKQAILAKQHGIHGFCFYLYWFSGKRLLEKPLDLLLEHPEIDINFCLCWANENWTRAWDGLDNEILINQEYNDQDPYNFISDIKKYIIDKRYIKFNGRPVIIVYNPREIPNFKDVIAIWRKQAIKAGIGEIAILITSIHGNTAENLNVINEIDGEVDFPPNDPLSIKPKIYSFYKKSGTILNYEKAVTFYIRKITSMEKRKIPVYHTCMLAWDNAARKSTESTTFTNFSLKTFYKWASTIVDESSESFMFVNAWNEWAEGTYLEPDKKYGYANINTLSKAIYGLTFDGLNQREISYIKKGSDKKIIFVGHDASNNGAQLLALNIIRQLTEVFGYDVYLILKSGGPLIFDFKEIALKTICLDDCDRNEQIKNWIIATDVKKAICNTVVTGDILHLLTECGVACISLIHEMENMIYKYSDTNRLNFIVSDALKIVFPSNYVKKSVEKIIPIPEQKTVIRPQGMFAVNPYLTDRDIIRSSVRKNHNIPLKGRIILGVGIGDHRKGIDLFVQCMLKVCKTCKDVYFIWIGDIESMTLINSILKGSKLENRLFLTGWRADYMLYYVAADIYLLTSREDPFPSVVIEAMYAHLPVIAFENGGGYVEIVNEKTGVLVPMENIDAMSEHTIKLLNNNDSRSEIGNYAHNFISENFNFAKYIYFLLHLLGTDYKKISVIIPNYNYAIYLKERIDSILTQTYPIFEIIILDDCSTDDSFKIIDEYAKEFPLRIKVVKNYKNSGSVFKQWAKGIEMAKGDYIWVAEADDLASPLFLEKIINKMSTDEDIVMGYTQSKIMDEYDKITGDNYLFYTDEIDTIWNSDYVSNGREEIEKRLSIKNTILNVSAVVFKNKGLDKILKDVVKYNIAGDWRLYVDLLKEGGKVLFIADSLNIHRRHTGSVTKALNAKKHYDEICEMQEYVYNLTNNSEYFEKAKKYREEIRINLGIDNK